MANDIDRQAKLQNAMSRAKKLIKLEENGTLDKIAKGARDGINDSLDGSVMTQQLLTTPRDRNMEAPIVGGVMGENAKNVPSAIRESFAKMNIDNSSLYNAFAGGGASSDLDFLTENAEPQTTKRVNSQTQDVRQLVTEGLGRGNSQYVQQSSAVDYPMIRTIVEEIVRKYTVSLKNKILTENKGNGNEVNTISLGKTFKFLSNDGTIYECTMKKIGNINSKKKSVVN